MSDEGTNNASRGGAAPGDVPETENSAGEPVALVEPLASTTPVVTDDREGEAFAAAPSADSVDSPYSRAGSNADADAEVLDRTSYLDLSDVPAPSPAAAQAQAHPAPPVSAPTLGQAPEVASSPVEDASRLTSPSTPPRQEYAPERVFISTPAEPRRRGNRGIGVLIALGAVIPFGILLAAIAAIILATVAPEQPFGPIFTLFFASPLFYVPAILFVIAFIVLVLIGNRAGWWAYVLGSLFVGAFVYFGTIGVELVARNLLTMTPAEASEQFATAAANPFVIAAGLAAREVAMWIGSIIAVRGRRVKERNLLARLDYERELAEHQAEFAKTRYPFE